MGLRFDVITLFEDIIKDYTNSAILGRAQKNEIIEVNTINPRDFTTDKYKKVDDTPYGGSDGMVLMCDPIFKSYESIDRVDNSEFIILTPSGTVFNQQIAQELSNKEQIILLCGRYEGFDQRIIDGLKPREISIGDYVLTGGELGAMCIIDSVSRFKEGFLGSNNSALFDSFSDELDGLLEHPQYTKPREYRGLEVPEVLLNGHHREIEKFRLEKRIEKTKNVRPDLYEKYKSKRDNSWFLKNLVLLL